MKSQLVVVFKTVGDVEVFEFNDNHQLDLMEEFKSLIKNYSSNIDRINLIYPVYWNQMPYEIKKFFDCIMIDYDKTEIFKDIKINTIVSLGNATYYEDEEYREVLKKSLHDYILERLNTSGEFKVFLGSKNVPPIRQL
jgi:multimeric flavodoxin WrbA